MQVNTSRRLVRVATPQDHYGAKDWFQAHQLWYFKAVLAGFSHQASAAAVIAPWKAAVLLGVWAVSCITPVMMIKPMTEHLDETPNIYGDTRWAEERDINAMSSKDIVGFDGELFIVGKLKEKFIRMKETLSVLLLAPPGTGKNGRVHRPQHRDDGQKQHSAE